MKKKSEIPPMPAKDRMLGDKTHALVEWYQKYHPDQFKVIYANRNTHLGYVTEDGTIINAPQK